MRGRRPCDSAIRPPSGHGVSKTTVSNWRQGHKEPSLSSIIKLAEVFEIDPVKFTQEPFISLLEDLLDVSRFIHVESRVFDETQPGLPENQPKVLPLKERTDDAGTLE